MQSGVHRSQCNQHGKVEDGAGHHPALEVEVASGFVRRLTGLLGRRRLPPGTALLLEPCSSVHTVGMRFALDLVYLGRDRQVVKVVRNVRPWRVSFGGPKAHATLELGAGEAGRLDIVPGTRIRMQS